MPDHDKETHTIYVSTSVFNQARALGIPISETIERVLRLLITQYGQTAEEVELAVLKATETQWQNDLDAYEAQLVPFRTRVEKIKEKIVLQEAIVTEIRRSEKIASLMKTLNAIIKDVEYDFAKTKELAAKELQGLNEFDISTTDEWIRKQIDRLARLPP